MLLRAESDRRFYWRSSLGLIAFIVLGFGGRALTQHEEDAPALAVLAPHIVCIVGWYLLFAVQAFLIGKGRHQLHRRLGRASVVLVIGLLVSGVLVTSANFRLKGDAPLVFFNLLNLAQFAVLYVWAVLRVRDPALHKRLLLFASIAMMPPALVRLIQTFGLPEVATVGLIVGWCVPSVLHDRATLGRVHRGTWIGLAAIGIGLAIGGPIGFSAGWRELVVAWFGEPA
ncbi:MAG: hypothetical protein NXI31_08835 [bacterium]|nr:hypothetical protein [bacterium]